MKSQIVRLSLVVLATGAVPLSAQSNQAEAGGSVVIRGASVFDGERSLGRRDVLVENGTIRRVARSITKVPAGVETVDGKGRTLMPGLIDAHVHSIPGGPADALRFGVTTEIEMYAFEDDAATAARRAQRTSVARTAQADVWSSGAGITPPGGHPTQMVKGTELDGKVPVLGPSDEAGAFIAARVARGADHIKVIQDDGDRGDGKKSLNAFSEEQYRAVLSAAAASGKTVVVHAQRLADARIAVASGADVLAHALADSPPDGAMLADMKRRKVAMIGTLAVYDSIGRGGQTVQVLEDPALAPALSPFQKMMLSIKFRAAPAEYAAAAETVRRAHRAGVTIIAGSDAPNPGTAFGASLHRDLELLTDAGLSPAAALTAATASPARVFGLTDRGRISPGLRGDLVMVDGDPLKQIAATRRIVTVWKNGYAIDRTAPTSMPGQ